MLKWCFSTWKQLNNYILYSPAGGCICYWVLCQKLSLDWGTHFSLQSCWLGSSSAAVRILKLPFQTWMLKGCICDSRTLCLQGLHDHIIPSRDSADRVVGEKGSYEELIACSNEIAASTAQLVAASKVQTQVKVMKF